MTDNTIKYSFIKLSMKGGLASSFTNFLVKIFTLVNVVIILKFLTIYQYGVYKLSVSVFAVLSGLLLSGLNGIIINDISNYLGKEKHPSVKRLLFEYLILKISLGVFAWAVLFFGAELIAKYYNPGVAGYVKILSFLYLVNPIINFFDIIFASALNFWITGLIPVFTEISKLFLLIYFFIIIGGGNITSVLWISVISPIVTLLFLVVIFFIKYGKEIEYPKKDKYILWKIIRAHGKWAVAKSYIRTLPGNLRLWLIKIIISTEAVAIFSVAESIFLAIKGLVPINIFASIIPRKTDNKKNLSIIFKKSIKYFFIFYSLIGVLMFFIAPSLVRIFFPQYQESIIYIKVFILILPVYSLLLANRIVYSLRMQKFLFIQPLIQFFSVVIFGGVLIYFMGIYGVIVEYTLTSLLLTSITYLYLCKRYPIFKIKFREIFNFDDKDKEVIKYLKESFLKK